MGSVELNNKRPRGSGDNGARVAVGGEVTGLAQGLREACTANGLARRVPEATERAVNLIQLIAPALQSDAEVIDTGPLHAV